MTDRPALSLDRSRPPAAGPAQQFDFPEFVVERLGNGLQIYVARYPRGPLVHQLLIMPGGGQHDDPGQAGLTALTASMLDEGTDRQTAIELAYRVERLGGYLTSQGDWDSMSAALGVLAVHQRQGLELLAEVASGAAFPDHEFARLRQQQLAELQRRSARPAVQASDTLSRLLYGASIYGQPLLGTTESLDGIDLHDVRTHASRQITPDGAALILVGDLRVEESIELAAAAFGKWRGAPLAPPPAIEPPPLDGVEVCLIDRPQASQTELWMGHAGIPRNHPDRPGLAVLNSLLGGKFTSRVNLNLRERLGITYGISSSFAQRRGPGPFVVAGSVDNEAVGTAIGEILAELRRLQEEPVTGEELTDTQSYLLGIFPFTLQRIEGLADRLADLAVHDLPSHYFTSSLEQIAAVTASDLLDLARHHLDPERIGIVAVGPRESLEAQMKPFGELRIRPFSSFEDGTAAST